MRCRLTFLSSVVAIALSAGIPLNNIDPGVLPDGRDAEFACGSAKDHTQFAYVMMHYEGTPKDPEYVLGTRVLIKSLQASGTKQDLVILASNSVSAATIRTFCADGAIVQVGISPIMQCLMQ